jgi:TonB family protein
MCEQFRQLFGLDRKAVETVRTWKFEPAVINDKRSELQLEIEVDFRLERKPQDPTTDPSVVPQGADNSNPAARIVKTPSPCTTQTNGCFTPPRMILSPMPEALPPSSHSTKYSGTAALQLTVTTDGIPTDIKVLKSLGRGLDEMAISAVQKWKFAPAEKDGTPVATQIVVEVEFHLE